MAGTQQLNIRISFEVAKAVTLDTDLVFNGIVCNGIWVAGAGSVRVVNFDGSTSDFQGVAAGTVMGIRCKQVSTTGTSATGLVALY